MNPCAASLCAKLALHTSLQPQHISVRACVCSLVCTCAASVTTYLCSHWHLPTIHGFLLGVLTKLSLLTQRNSGIYWFPHSFWPNGANWGLWASCPRDGSWKLTIRGSLMLINVWIVLSDINSRKHSAREHSNFVITIQWGPVSSSNKPALQILKNCLWARDKALVLFVFGWLYWLNKQWIYHLLYYEELHTVRERKGNSVVQYFMLWLFNFTETKNKETVTCSNTKQTDEAAAHLISFRLKWSGFFTTNMQLLYAKEGKDQTWVTCDMWRYRRW